MTTETEITGVVEQAQVSADAANETSIAVLADAEKLVINTDVEYGQSGELLKQIKARQRELELTRKSVTGPLDEAKRRVMALFTPANDRLAKAENTIKRAILAFSNERERRRREAQAKLDEAARKERERLLQHAATQQRKGKEEKAAAMREQAAAVPDLEVSVAPTPKVSGISTRVTWHAEVIDPLALLEFILSNVKAGALQLGLNLIEPNMKELNALARLHREDLNIPGVAAVSEEGIAAQG